MFNKFYFYFLFSNAMILLKLQKYRSFPKAKSYDLPDLESIFDPLTSIKVITVSPDK
jgi:hypothetical protein